MPRVIDFKLVGDFKNVAQYEDYKIELYRQSITHTKHIPCTMCGVEESSHKMKVQYSSCINQACMNEEMKCLKRYKLTICQAFPDIDKQKCILYQFGRHNSYENVIVHRGLTDLVKSYIDQFMNDYGISTPKKILLKLVKINNKAKIDNSKEIDIMANLSQVRNYLVYQRTLNGLVHFFFFF